ncbi:MAG: Hpt domain-containing protein [Candidatus Methylomirabilis sp.]|nr:Hpt domain-containing protein [Candidatus Methylomirabilis sp.]
MTASRNQEIKARLLATFRVEAEEHLQAITTNLLALEGGPPPAQTRELVEATFREMHTLKGAARSVSLMDVEALCQACESVLSQVVQGRLVLNRSLVDGVQEAVDGVARLLSGHADSTTASDLIRRLEETGDRGRGLGVGPQSPTPISNPNTCPLRGHRPAIHGQAGCAAAAGRGPPGPKARCRGASARSTRVARGGEAAESRG